MADKKRIDQIKAQVRRQGLRKLPKAMRAEIRMAKLMSQIESRKPHCSDDESRVRAARKRQIDTVAKSEVMARTAKKGLY